MKIIGLSLIALFLIGFMCGCIDKEPVPASEVAEMFKELDEGVEKARIDNVHILNLEAWNITAWAPEDVIELMMGFKPDSARTLVQGIEDISRYEIAGASFQKDERTLLVALKVEDIEQAPWFYQTMQSQFRGVGYEPTKRIDADDICVLYEKGEEDIFLLLKGNYVIIVKEESGGAGGKAAEAATPTPTSEITGVPTDAVLILHFDGGSGNIAKDASGNGNDGAIYGATWTTGISGKALSFDGEDDYVNCGNDDSLNVADGSFTLCAWFKTSGTEEDIISNGVYTNGDHLLMSYKTKLRGHIWYSGNSNTIDSINVVSDNQWHFGCQVVDDTKIYLYVDGALDNSQNLVGTKTGLIADTLIGDRDKSGNSNNFNGIIDEVAIYSRALTPEEIKAHYHAKRAG